jgi:hypothetical protein
VAFFFAGLATFFVVFFNFFCGDGFLRVVFFFEALPTVAVVFRVFFVFFRTELPVFAFFRADTALLFRVALRFAIEIPHPSDEPEPLSDLLSRPQRHKSIPAARVARHDATSPRRRSLPSLVSPTCRTDHTFTTAC